MKLSNETLTDHFTFKYNMNQHGNQVHWCPYNFVDNKKKNLVITIGDSWTWGADLCDEEDTETRLKHVFGSTVANELSADFLNLGQSGACNLHAVQKVRELKTIIPLLNYEKIFVICTYTEACRSIDGEYDKKVDYVSMFQTHDFRDILAFNNGLFQNEIVELEQQFPHVKLLAGTTFVEPIGMDARLHLLSKTWTEIYNEKIIQQDYIKPCYIVSHWVFDRLRNFIISFNPDINRVELNDWMITLLDQANLRKEFTLNQKYFAGISHPLKPGHDVWARYILENL